MTLTKGKSKVANITLTGLHTFQAGLGRKKSIENFRIWFWDI